MKSFLTGLFGPLALSCVLAVGTVAIAQDTPQNPSSDNTKTNERDRNPSQATADQQKENRPDRDITRDIRRAIMTAPYAAKRCLISQGTVTLRARRRDAKRDNSSVRPLRGLSRIVAAGSPFKSGEEIRGCGLVFGKRPRRPERPGRFRSCRRGRRRKPGYGLRCAGLRWFGNRVSFAEF